MFTVYRLDFPDGSAYVGRTAKDPRDRLLDHITDAHKHPKSRRPIRLALRHYGPDDVRVSLLWRGTNFYQSKGREIGLIGRARKELGPRLLNRTRGGFLDVYDAGKLVAKRGRLDARSGTGSR